MGGDGGVGSQSILYMYNGGTLEKLLTYDDNLAINMNCPDTQSGFIVNGGLTVDTNTLKVDAVNNRVGIVKSSPAYPLDVTGNVNVSTGSAYKVNGTDVLTSTTLGSGVTSSSLTSVGTLSSLNVTGDVTIDSTTLKVDSTNNRVGIVNNSPSVELDVVGKAKITGGGDSALILTSSTRESASTVPLKILAPNASETNDTVSLVIGKEETDRKSAYVQCAFGDISHPGPSLDNNEICLGFYGQSPVFKISSTGKVGIPGWRDGYILNATGSCNLAGSGSYAIDTTTVLDKTTLGSGVVNSSLTSVGTLSSLTVSGNVTIDSTTLKVDSTNNRVGIVNASPAYPLDVVGDTNLSSGSVLRINGTSVLSKGTTDDIVTIGGTNVYFPDQQDDLVCTITPRTGGSMAPIVNINSTGVYGYEFLSNALREVSFQVQLNHQWKEGSSVIPHFHWVPTTTNTSTAVFSLDYWVVNIGEAIPSVTTVTVNVTPNGTAYKHQLTEFGSVTMTGKTASCIFGGRIYRSGGTGSDAFTGDAIILGVDLHVTRNRWGYVV